MMEGTGGTNDISDKLGEAERKEVVEKGYRDVSFVLLRNGGMLVPDDGTKSPRNLFWKFFHLFILSWYSVLIVLLTTSLYRERHNIDNLLEAAHYTVMIVSLTCGNVDFLYYREDIDVLLKFVGLEFFQYDEEEQELYKEMKRKNLKEVKLISRVGVILYFMMFVIIAIIQPYIYYIVMKDEPYDINEQNGFLPVPMHFPWNTFSTNGFLFAYFLQLVGAFLVVQNVIANGFSYVNLMVVFRCQLEILNHSIKNIDSRAMKLYRNKYGIMPDAAVIRDELKVDDNLKKCFCECLKQNAMHHQCLLRWEVTSRKMLRVILLFVFFNASILMATTGYLLVKNLNSKVRTFKFLQLLVTEIFHTFLFCYYGEQVSQQSEDLFDNLYDMEWYKYGKDFNSLLLIMMTVTVKPLRSLTAIFNTPCSMETFNALMSTAYSYFSLINGMKENL